MNLIMINSCPFCGYNPILEDICDEGHMYYIECKGENCKILGPYADTQEEAIKKWNTRI